MESFATTLMYILIAVAVVYAVVLIVSSYKKTQKIFSEKTTKYLANYHTHTNLCDGHNTAEEMVQSAIDKGFFALGFSGHSHLSTEPEWTMSEEGEEEYIETVLALREKYKEQIQIWLGIEQDYWSDPSNLAVYDYVIGSVHSLVAEDTTWSSIDYSYDNFNYGVEHYFGGDRMAAVEKYFELVGNLYERTHCNVIGHFDLITIFNEMYFKEKGELFVDTENPRFIEAEKKALEKLVQTPVIFEINTGAIIRGKRTTPYPSERVLQFLSEHNTKVIISSDAHTVDALDGHFDEALKLVEKYHLNLVDKPKTYV